MRMFIVEHDSGASAGASDSQHTCAAHVEPWDAENILLRNMYIIWQHTTNRTQKVKLCISSSESHCIFANKKLCFLLLLHSNHVIRLWWHKEKGMNDLRHFFFFLVYLVAPPLLFTSFTHSSWHWLNNKMFCILHITGEIAFVTVELISSIPSYTHGIIRSMCRL